MKVTEEQKNVIQDYLNHYYEMYENSNDALPFKTQMELLYGYVSQIVE